MPVSGLPAAVERTLTALLTDNALLSWKITGNGDRDTVVVLRLKPVNTVNKHGGPSGGSPYTGAVQMEALLPGRT